MLVGVVLAVVVIIALKIVLGFFEVSDPVLSDTSGTTGHDRVELKTVMPQESHQVLDDSTPSAGHEAQTLEGSGLLLLGDSGSAIQEKPAHGGESNQTHGSSSSADTHTVPVTPRSVAAHETTAPAQSTDHNIASDHAPASGAAGQTAEGHGPVTESFPVEGMAFVNALIQPLDNELNRRFYGWRPNDILNVTDNVNNFQLGVLEVTRRTAVILAQRISRTGSTASFDSDLENAMNWLMIKADRYWFPSAESKYRASLDEMRNYFHRLERGEAQFYTRTDNLIPLLTAYQDLLGSSDENLVKSHEDDGSPVGYFKSDDYFYYAQGVASAMVTILEAIEKDFNIMVSREGGMELLHHAIESCHHAMEIDPWIILNSDMSSVFANHRLNMAAPISHARFYLGVLIRALST
jgi:hypothetical protein